MRYMDLLESCISGIDVNILKKKLELNSQRDEKKQNQMKKIRTTTFKLDALFDWNSPKQKAELSQT